MRQKDNSYIWVESSIRLLDESQAKEAKLIVVSRNIHRRKLAEQKLQEANELLHRLSTIDGLTEIANRRTFDERLEKEWEVGQERASPLSLIMFDIDYFKAYNDTYGHQGGDFCLKQVAKQTEKALGDVPERVFRYGGEEFGIILANTDNKKAIKTAEIVRKTIEQLQIPHVGSEINKWLTISVGVATVIPEKSLTPSNLITYADQAVYAAKQAGRNCVRHYEKSVLTHASFGKSIAD